MLDSGWRPHGQQRQPFCRERALKDERNRERDGKSHIGMLGVPSARSHIASLRDSTSRQSAAAGASQQDTCQTAERLDAG
jgi:hypothetical protein